MWYCWCKTTLVISEKHWYSWTHLHTIKSWLIRMSMISISRPPNLPGKIPSWSQEMNSLCPIRISSILITYLLSRNLLVSMIGTKLSNFTKEVGYKVNIMGGGDDPTVTNIFNIRQAADKGWANCLILNVDYNYSTYKSTNAVNAQK